MPDLDPYVKSIQDLLSQLRSPADRMRAMEQAILEGDGDRTFIIPQKCELIKIANKLFNHVHPPIRKSREARKDAL